jgi:hypothetical protein
MISDCFLDQHFMISLWSWVCLWVHFSSFDTYRLYFSVNRLRLIIIQKKNTSFATLRLNELEYFMWTIDTNALVLYSKVTVYRTHIVEPLVEPIM